MSKKKILGLGKQGNSKAIAVSAGATAPIAALIKRLSDDNTTLTQRAIRGTVWIIIGAFVLQLPQFLTNLLLARLLIPEWFGLMALANTFLSGLNLFSNFGIRENIIQNHRGDEPVFLNTAWTLQVLRGFGLYLICLLITIPVAKFSDDERLLWLLPIIGLSSIIAGFSSTNLLTLERHLRLGKLIRFEVGVEVVSSIILCILVWLNPTIWNFLIGVLLKKLFKTVGSYWLIPGSSNRLTWESDALSIIFAFGKWILAITILESFSFQASQLIFSRFRGLELLGIYILAFSFANLLPKWGGGDIGNRILFPAISRRAHLPRASLRIKILRKRGIVVIVSAVGSIILVGFGDLLITPLFGDRYIEAAWMVPILGLGSWFTFLQSIAHPCLLGIGKPSYIARGHLLRLLTNSIVLVLALTFTDILGAIIVIAVTELLVYAVICYGLCREGLNFIRQDLLATALLIGSVTLILLVRISFGWELPINAITELMS